MIRIEFKPFNAKDDSIQMFVDVINDIIIEGLIPQMMIFPIIPRAFSDGLFNEEYGLTRYIGGIDGDVVTCNTNKCKQN